MTVPDWPSDLPRPTRDGYGAQRQDPRVRRDFDHGPPGWRRRFSAVGRYIQLTVILDYELKAVFDRFYIDTIAEGAGVFWMADFVEDGLPLLDEAGLVLLDESDTPILGTKIMLCQFAGEAPVEGPLQGSERAISFSVMELPR